jgi:pyruvate formate lyase activating enzyme
MPCVGTIFNIQRYSIHDGPGIRTTIFLKGYPLRCYWCANPESQSPEPQLMTRDVKCIQCGNCVKACPEGALTLKPDAGRIIDWGRCTQCLECVSACPFGAISVNGWRTDVQCVLEEAKRDLVFYQTSGGGVTVSGGEPLFQSDFTKSLLASFQSHGLHTALDTTGYAPQEVFLDVLKHTNLLLIDVKHLDPKKHKISTGGDNSIILENMRAAAAKTTIWVRVPLIQGFNDSIEHIEAIAELSLEIGAERISLLPYHEGGMAKTSQIGKKYRMPGAKAPDENTLKELLEAISRTGVPASLGR